MELSFNFSIVILDFFTVALQLTFQWNHQIFRHLVLINSLNNPYSLYLVYLATNRDLSGYLKQMLLFSIYRRETEAVDPGIMLRYLTTMNTNAQNGSQSQIWILETPIMLILKTLVAELLGGWGPSGGHQGVHMGSLSQYRIILIL